MLCLAGIITPVYLSQATALPLNAGINEKDFKLLLLDIGLVKYASRIDATVLLKENLMLVNQGYLAEQFVGQELIAYQPSFDHPELFYWHKAQTKGSAEIDYVFQYRNYILPLEVKSGVSGRLKSLHAFMNEKKSPIGIKTSQDTFYFEGKIASIPLYLLSQLHRILSCMKR